MRIIAILLSVFVALEHFGFMALEMVYWTQPFGMKTFNTTPDFAKASAALAANQGLYNGLLAAAIVFAVATWNRSMLLVMLACIVVAGIYGAATVKPSIALIQALPAVLAFATVWLARPNSN